MDNGLNNNNEMIILTPKNSDIKKAMENLFSNPQLYNQREENGLTERNINIEDLLRKTNLNQNETEHSIILDNQSDTFRSLNKQINMDNDLVSNILSHEPIVDKNQI